MALDGTTPEPRERSSNAGPGRRRKRVLLVNHTDRVRPEVEMLTSGLADDRVDLSVVLPESCRDEFDPPEGVETRFYAARYVPNIRYTLPSPSFVRTMRDQLRDADVAHVFGYAHLPSLAATQLSQRFDVGTVVTVDAFPGVSWSYGNRFVDAVAKAYTHAFARLIFAAADRVVGLGEYLRGDFARFVDDQSKVAVVPNGVDTETYRPRTGVDGGRARSSDADPSPHSAPDPVRLLFVGRLDTVKGIPHLLDALALLARRSDVDYRLTLVGDGSRRADYEDRSRELGVADAVSFEGWQDDVLPYYRDHDVFVLPSLSEGLPTVLMEAQACGVPVVATDVGGARELVRGGYLVPRRSPDALARAIEALSTGNLEERGAIARRHVVDEYSVESMARSYTDLYDEVAPRP